MDPSSFNNFTEFTVWHAVLLQQISFNDYDIKALWSCSRSMQGLMRKYLKKVTVWMRPHWKRLGERVTEHLAPQEIVNPCYLSFFEKLANATEISLKVDQHCSFLRYLRPERYLSELPKQIQYLVLSSPDAMDAVLPLLKNFLIKERPHIAVVFGPLAPRYLDTEFDNNIYAYYDCMRAILCLAPQSDQPFPCSLLRFTILHEEIYDHLHSGSFTGFQLSWLSEHWYPMITTIRFKRLPDGYTAEDALRISRKQAQICQCFPNLTTVNNGIHLPVGTSDTKPVTEFHYCSGSRYVSYLPFDMIFPLAFTKLHTLTLTLYLNPDISPLAHLTLPPTLVVLELEIITETEHNNFVTIHALFDRLPVGLKTLKCIIVISGESPGDEVPLRIWNKAVIAKLPRALERLITEDFPRRLTCWKALPPRLKEFYMVSLHWRTQDLINKHYQILSSDIEELSMHLHHPHTKLNDHRCQLSTIQRFQSLQILSLNLTSSTIISGTVTLPPTITDLSLALYYQYNDFDQVSWIEWPQSLMTLNIRGDHGKAALMLHPAAWYPLPRSCNTLEFNEVTLRSVPDLWMNPLRYLTFCSQVHPAQSLNVSSVQKMVEQEIIRRGKGLPHTLIWYANIFAHYPYPLFLMGH